MFAHDDHFIKAMKSIFTLHRLSVISKPHKLMNTEFVRNLLSENIYDTVIFSNYGIPISLVKEHVRQMPESNKLRAIMITGFIDNFVEETCRKYNIRLIRAPFELSDLFDAIDTTLN